MRTVTMPNGELLTLVAEMLSAGNTITLRAKGSSMQPFIIGDRDSVVLQKPDMLHIGGIVLAEIAPLKFVLHRIIKMENDHIILRGDGNLYGTEKCSRENIFGKAVTIIRNGKEIACHKKSERIKVWFWQKLLPLRRYLLAIYRRTT